MKKVNDLNKIFKALADKSRLRIVKMLQQKDLCVCEITAVLGLATSTVSNHLSILKNAGIIGDMKDGKWVEHHLVTETNNHFLNGLLPLLSFWFWLKYEVCLVRRRLDGRLDGAIFKKIGLDGLDGG